MVDLVDRPLERAVTPQEPASGRFVVQVSTLVSLALILALGGLVAFGVSRGLDVRADAAERSDRTAVVKAARAEILALTQVSATTSDSAIQELLSGATDDFQAQLQDQAEAFRSALSEAKVTSTGSVASAGVASLADGQAEVLVAATGSVKNDKTKTAQPRTYRFLVRLEEVGSRWLVSGLEFVA